MKFSEWVEQELNRRGWNHSDLVRRSEETGYAISQSQFWRIMNEERQAGPDACISIAVALGISREEVFRARGWLLREADQIVRPEAGPEVRQAVSRLQDLPQGSQERAAFALDALLDAMEAEIRRNDPELAARIDNKLSDEQQVGQAANNGLRE